jgi:hypothetical protein
MYMRREGSAVRSEADLRKEDRTPERRNIMMYNMTSKIDTLPGATVDIVDIRVTKPCGIGGLDHSYMLRNGSCFELKSPQIADSPKPKLFTRDQRTSSLGSFQKTDFLQPMFKPIT